MDILSRDPDYPMELDENVVSSTELDQAQQTVDPSVFDLNGGAVDVRRQRGEMAFHGGPQQPLPFSAGSGNIIELSDDEDDLSDDSPIARIQPTYRTYVQIQNPPPAKAKHLPYSSKRSGLVYDVRMRFHTEYPDAMEFGGMGADLHPEDPRRIYEIFQALVEAGLVQDDQHPILDEDFQLFRISARHAQGSEICLVHHKSHYRAAKGYKGKAQIIARLGVY